MAVSTDSNAQGLSMLTVRVVLGVIMLYYGLRDVFGLMGGSGFQASSQEFADSFGLLLYVGQIVVISKLVSGVFLIFGILTRFAAVFVVILMTVGAVAGAKTTQALLNTTSEDPLAAVGYPTALVILAFVLVMLGGGMLAVDSKIFTSSRTTRSKAQEA